jgi:hypothetical protein
MTVTMKICAEGRVLFFTYIDPLTMKEIEDFYDKNREHRDSVPYTVHTLLDVRAMSKIPMGVLRTRGGPGFTHQRSGKIVIIGASYLARSLVEVSAHFTGNVAKLKFYNTLEDGWTYLREIISAEDHNIDVGCS